jgi:hypothetical protein
MAKTGVAGKDINLLKCRIPWGGVARLCGRRQVFRIERREEYGISSSGRHDVCYISSHGTNQKGQATAPKSFPVWQSPERRNTHLRTTQYSLHKSRMKAYLDVTWIFQSDLEKIDDASIRLTSKCKWLPFGVEPLLESLTIVPFQDLYGESRASN